MKVLHKWLIILGIIAATAVVSKLYSLHNEALKAARQEIITEYDQQDVKEFEKQLKSSKELFEKDLNNQKDYAKKLSDDNARLQLTITSLRSRPSRTTTSQSVSDSPSCETAGTGAGLYREDAEFLIGEASRASAVVAERDYYYAAYRAAEDKLKELNGKD